ncbi:zinc metalloprotease mde10 [Xylariaceae sp. FL1272]|nr:zinc metalloprotease mde10 [Xylariaceae sp. FL1272]
MRFSLAATAVFFSIFSHPSEAHSVQRNPLNYITLVDSPTLHTPSSRVHAHTSFDLSFFLHDVKDKIRIVLEPNRDVLSDTATIHHLAPDGTIRYEEKIDRSQHKIYKGHAYLQHPHHSEWLNTGWARVTVFQDGRDPLFEGTFKVNGDQHHIQRASTYRQTRLAEDPLLPRAGDDYMIVWRDSDVVPDLLRSLELKRDSIGGSSSCSSNLLDFNARVDHPVHMGWDIRELDSTDPQSIFGRQTDTTTGGNGAVANLTSTIGSSEGCPTARKVALIGIATDCTYTALFDSKSNVTTNVINIVNQASQVYEDTFNISLGIQNLTISDGECPGSPPAGSQWNQQCSSSVTITDRLVLFSKWRGQFNDTNAYWTLLSTCNTEAAVGLAWLGQLCKQGSEPNGNDTTAGANVVIRTNTEWQVFAHETGHTFGAYHDCVETTCADGTYTAQQCCPLNSNACDADGKYIMNPSTSSGITQFSPCTVGNICSAMQRNSINSECLSDNKNVVTISGSQCGNGIVEQGEECDCGGETGCKDNPCCNASTCKFTTNSVCDPGNEDCCTDQCQFASSGTTCRASTGSCDPAEMCSGSSGDCPEDNKAEDGTKCGADGDGLKCASGQCTSRDLQCQTLVGSLIQNDDTTACNEDTCVVRCKSSTSSLACYDYQQYFLDGTPCDGSGKCQNGKCKGASTTDKIATFFRDNKEVVIPVASAVGGLILVAIASCCCTCIRRRRRRNRIGAGIRPNGPRMPRPNGQAGWRNKPSNHSSFEQQQMWQQPPPPARFATERYA